MKNHEIEITAIGGSEDGIVIWWQGNNGFGSYTIATDGNKFLGLSECMDKGEHKDFLKEVLDALVRQVEIIE